MGWWFCGPRRTEKVNVAGKGRPRSESQFEASLVEVFWGLVDPLDKPFAFLRGPRRPRRVLGGLSKAQRSLLQGAERRVLWAG